MNREDAKTRRNSLENGKTFLSKPFNGPLFSRFSKRTVWGFSSRLRDFAVDGVVT